MAVLRDLAEITHWLSVAKISPDAADDPTIGPHIRARGLDIAARLPMRVLTRTWQMLLKALEEVAAAPNAMMAAEMAVIRLTHVADLPSPEELVRRLEDAPGPATPPPPGRPASAGAAAVEARAAARRGGGAAKATAPAPSADTALARFANFQQVVELIRANRDVGLLLEVEETLRLAAYSPGRIEFVPTDDAAADLAQRLGRRLQSWTGVRWAVSVRAKGGGETLAERRDARDTAQQAAARELTLVQAVLAAFPDAKVVVRDPTATDETSSEEADGWDPFEEG
jgi:DNA polymerase-3 subunit gamma/tau